MRSIEEQLQRSEASLADGLLHIQVVSDFAHDAEESIKQHLMLI